MSSINPIDYSQKIPNNVDLNTDRTLQRALEHWQPSFLDWWRDMGPTEWRTLDVYLRTAVGVDASGWARSDYIKNAHYRWGISSIARRGPQDRLWRAQGRAGMAGGAGRIPRQSAPHHRHPGRHRARFSGTAAPAGPELSVALRPAQPVPGQCRGRPPTCGRWSICCTRTSRRSPRGGRALLERHSGDADNPRIWGRSTRRRRTGCRFRFTFFTDRDGKFPALGAGRVGIRSAGADDAFHAHRGSASHVRWRHGHQPHPAAHRRSHGPRQDRRSGTGARPRP